jgi:hypothetical protein
MPDPQYPSAAGATTSPFNRGPMTSVEGDYASSASASPSSFGGNVDLASAFEGTLSDMRAVAQQTISTLSDIGIMAQRVSSMLGGTGGGGDGAIALPVPNQLPSSPFGSNTSSPNVTAAISQAMGLSYGSAANATPQFNPSYATLPPEITNPAYASIPVGFGGGGIAQPVPNQLPAPQGGETAAPPWQPSTPERESKDPDIQRIKHLTETAIGGEFVKNEGGATAGGVKNLLTHPSVRGITQSLASKLGSYNDKWAPGQIKYSGRGKDFGSGAAWNTVPQKVQTRLSDAAMGGDSDAINALQTAAIEGVPVEASGIGAGIGSLASGGSLAEAGGAALGGGIMAGVGIAAIPITAAVLGLHEMESQRATNAAIQSQIGGSNFSAYGTRAQGLGFGLTQMGTMSMGMANQAFSGVTDMGLQGGDRSNALNFITSNYSSMGMSVADSLNLVNTSVKAGNANLSALAATLDAVTNSAAAASVNTEQARQNFSAMYSTGIASGMSTQGAASLAGGSQMMTNMLGKSGAGVQFGLASNAQAAAANGVSIATYENKIASDPSGSYAARAQAVVEQQRLGAFGAGIPNVQHLASMALKNQSGVHSEFATQSRNAGVLDEMLPGILSGAGISTQGVSLNGQWDAYAMLKANPNSLPTYVNKNNAETSINQQIAGLRPGNRQAGDMTGTWSSMTRNHQLSGAQSNIDNYIQTHQVNSAGAGVAASLLAHGSKDFVSGSGFGVGGNDKESVLAALGDPRTAALIMAGKGTINGQSVSKWAAQHKTSLTPKSSTSSNKKGDGTVTISLTPAAAQLVQVATSGAAQIGNNYGTINTPPTGVTPYQNAFSGA